MIDETDTELLPLGFTKENIGISQDGAHTLHGYRYGDFQKPTVFITSNIHGSEWWTAFFCLDVLKDVIGLGFYDKLVAGNLRDAYSWYYIPSANPYGFENNQYNNVRQVNLNRNFDNNWETYVGNAAGEGNNYKGESVASEAETQAVCDKFLEILPILAIDCHTTSGEGNGLDVQHLWRSNRTLMNDAVDSACMSIGNVPPFSWNMQFTPGAAGWYAKQTSKEGVQCTSTILESRSDTDRYNFGSTVLMTLLLTFYHRHKTGKQKLNSLAELKAL